MIREFSIRRFRESDFNRILEIEHDSFGTYAWDRNLFAEFCHKCGDLFLVAVSGRKICGYSITCLSGRARSTSAELVSIAVNPRYRGQGAATLLMAATLRRLRRRGITRVRLMVKVTNATAIRFYENLGFQRGRLVRGYYEDGSDGRQYEKRLA